MKPIVRKTKNNESAIGEDIKPTAPDVETASRPVALVIKKYARIRRHAHARREQL
jgi:hypothetical protein